MRPRPTAIGYLRRDVSGVSQVWDETQIRSVAKRLGYELAKTVVFTERTDHPVTRLMNVVRGMDVDAVIVPSGTDVPADLVRVADVVIVKPENTYARWGVGGGCTEGRTFSSVPRTWSATSS